MKERKKESEKYTEKERKKIEKPWLGAQPRAPPLSI